MALISNGLPTIQDLIKTKDAIGGVRSFANIVSRLSPSMAMFPKMQASHGNFHRTQILSGLPENFYVKINEGVPYSKTSTEERTFNITTNRARVGIDEELTRNKGAGDVVALRELQAMGHIESMKQEAESRLIYGTQLNRDPVGVPGLADYYNTIASSVEVSKNVISLGGTTANRQTSIYFLMLGPMTIHQIFAKGSMAGLERINRNPGGMPMPISTVDRNGNSTTMYGFEEEFRINDGLVVKDWRYGVRICNLDVSSSRLGVNSNPPNFPTTDLIKASITAVKLMPSKGMGRGVWLMGRTAEAILCHQARSEAKTGGGLNFQNYQGIGQVLMLQGYPVVVTDGILETEAVVT